MEPQTSAWSTNWLYDFFFFFWLYDILGYLLHQRIRNSVQILLNSVALFLHFLYISSFWKQFDEWLIGYSILTILCQIFAFLTKRHLCLTDFSVREVVRHKHRVKIPIGQKKKKEREEKMVYFLHVLSTWRLFKVCYSFYFWLHKRRHFIVYKFLFIYKRKLLKLIFFFYGCVGKMYYSFRSLELKILACSLTWWVAVVW